MCLMYLSIRKRVGIVLFCVLVIAVLFILPIHRSACGPLPEGVTANAAIVFELLQQDAQDRKSWDGRSRIGRIGNWTPQPLIEFGYPICYSHEKLVHLGLPAIPELL